MGCGKLRRSRRRRALELSRLSLTNSSACCMLPKPVQAGPGPGRAPAPALRSLRVKIQKYIQATWQNLSRGAIPESIGGHGGLLVETVQFDFLPAISTYFLLSGKHVTSSGLV